MTPENAKTSETRQSKDKPFPWRCPECGKKEVRPVAARIQRKSSTTADFIPWKFPNFASPSAARAASGFSTTRPTQIARHCASSLAFYRGDQIRRNRDDLGLSQRVLAEHLGVAVETISRWETGP